jgi:hypothetical protein
MHFAPLPNNVCYAPNSYRNIAVPLMAQSPIAVRSHPLRAAFHVVGTKRQIYHNERVGGAGFSQKRAKICTRNRKIELSLQ